MKIEDIVEWTSQSNGFVKTKRGKVVAVVPGGNEIKPELLESFDAHTLPSGGFGSARKRESYLISIRNKGKGRPSLYWPVAGLLKLVDLKPDIFIAWSWPDQKAARDFISEKLASTGIT